MIFHIQAEQLVVYILPERVFLWRKEHQQTKHERCHSSAPGDDEDAPGKLDAKLLPWARKQRIQHNPVAFWLHDATVDVVVGMAKKPDTKDSIDPIHQVNWGRVHDIVNPHSLKKVARHRRQYRSTGPDEQGGPSVNKRT